MKVIFLGTPSFAVPVMTAIQQSSHKIVCVVTQPDKVNGRNKQIVFSPVKQMAETCGIPVFQWEKISRDGVDTLKSFNADIMVTAAYGQILSNEILNLCKHGVINAHASLLPKYRGSSPVQWALINGEKEVGVTVMQTAHDVDSGDVILTKKITLDGSENTDECLAKLAIIGGSGIVEALDAIENGAATFTPQDSSAATFCKKLSKEDGHLNFNNSATTLVNFIRGVTPWPSAYADSDKYGRLKIIKAAAVACDSASAAIGEVITVDKKQLVIKCAEGGLSILTMQAEGGKALAIDAFLRGKPIEQGSVIK